MFLMVGSIGVLPMSQMLNAAERHDCRHHQRQRDHAEAHAAVALRRRDTSSSDVVIVVSVRGGFAVQDLRRNELRDVLERVDGALFKRTP